MDLQQSPTVSPEPPAAAPRASDARRKRGLQWRGRPSLRTIGAILVVALIAAVWLDTRSQLHELQQEIILLAVLDVMELLPD